MFLLLCLALSAGIAGLAGTEPADKLPDADWSKLPRWRGFNLLEKFSLDWSNKPFNEEDFRLISELGFNFVRLPMDYRVWIIDKDWRKLDENVLKEIDMAVGYGRKYGVHVCINFHRAPGFTVASPPEIRSLWYDKEALEVCAMHWAAFAKRYRGIPNSQLSFNLFNEPYGLYEDDYFRVVKFVCEAIRREDHGRLIIADGLQAGGLPSFELKALKVAQATRGYSPFPLTHYKAEWMPGSDRLAVPQWPLVAGDKTIDREWLIRRYIGPWKALQNEGVGVMVGEFGAYNKTPHDVVLRWMEDCLTNWKDAGWGWALWNFRGNFGILDSERSDVKYEDFKGHKLDRQMLELLKKY